MVAEGRVPYHEHDDRDIRQALAAALHERRIRLTDARLLILYLVNILIVVASVAFLSNAQHSSNVDRRHFQRAVITNCKANQANSIRFNDFIVKLQQTYAGSSVLTAQEKKERIAFFESVKGPIPECPPAQ